MSDGIISDFFRTKRNGQSIAPTQDARGRSTPPNKSNEELIKAHINSYHPQVSHYTREHAPNRRYIEAGLTITSKFITYVFNLARYKYFIMFNITF